MTLTSGSAGWRPDPILRVILGWTTLLGILFWLPLIRSVMDGSSYSWALGPFAGRGLGGDYGFVAAGAAVFTTLLYLGWRGIRPTLTVIALLALHAPLLLVTILAAIDNPDELRFRGDTLGIDISLAWVLPAVFAGFTALMLYWLLRRRSRATIPVPWTRINRWLLGVAIGLLPVQFILLRGPNDATDPAGVIATIVQWLLIATAVRPFGVARDIHPQEPAGAAATTSPR
jgi:hypothetical protein